MVDWFFWGGELLFLPVCKEYIKLGLFKCISLPTLTQCLHLSGRLAQMQNNLWKNFCSFLKSSVHMIGLNLDLNCYLLASLLIRCNLISQVRKTGCLFNSSLFRLGSASGQNLLPLFLWRASPRRKRAGYNFKCCADLRGGLPFTPHGWHLL